VNEVEPVADNDEWQLFGKVLLLEEVLDFLRIIMITWKKTLAFMHISILADVL